MNSFPFSRLFQDGQASANSIDEYHHASKLTDTNLRYVCLSESLRDLITKMLQVDPARRVTVESVIHHIWMQTGNDGIPGVSFEPFDAWGTLRIDPSPLQSPKDNNHKQPSWTRRQPPIDLFRERTVIGRSRKSHIQIPDSRVSAQHCEIVFIDSLIFLRNIGRNSISVNGESVPSGQKVALRDPFTFSLCPANNPADMRTASSAVPPNLHAYTFSICVLPKPWKQIWANSQNAAHM
ncbi:hypothetical protein GGI23_007362, partial [Coemansia sp. RSA 2559]